MRVRILAGSAVYWTAPPPSMINSVSSPDAEERGGQSPASFNLNQPKHDKPNVSCVGEKRGKGKEEG